MSQDQLLLFLAAVYLFAGMMYLHFHNGFTFLTAVYALVEIVTTIGYGDVNFVAYYDEENGVEVDTDIGKLFMSFYVIVGLSVIAGVVMKVAEKATDSAENAFRGKMRKAQMKASGMSEEQVKAQYGDKNKLSAAAVVFLVMIVFGTLFYGSVESCTCSYGRTFIPPPVTPGGPGCDPLNCAASTKAYRKTYIDAFYMSCISLTTVGFGDYAPKSEVGRVVGIFWMFIGVAVTGNFISEITSTFLEVKKERKNYDRISYDTFAEIDVDGNGTLSKYEFVSFVLLQYGLVKKEDLDEIIAMYDKLDASGDGVVTYEDIETFQENM